MSQYIQGSALSEFILPLMRASYSNPEKTKINIDELFGTGFLIGNRGYVITAAHVIDQLHESYDKENQVILTHFLSASGLFPFKIVAFEKHPTEDIGIVKIDNDNLTSILKIIDVPQNSSAEYHGWGYPREVAKEPLKLDETAKEQPDIIFTKGYIRRRINRELYPTFIYRGSSFYEVSEQGGSGYSGAPLILLNSIGHAKWQVIGVYIGEKAGEGVPVGYAVTAECFSKWVPDMLGCSVQEESLK